MAVKPKQTGDPRQGVKPGILVGAAIVLALFLGVLAWRNFGSSTGPVSTLTAQQHSDLDWVKQKAKESGGDFNRLRPEDQQKLYALHGKMAPFVLKQNARPAVDNY